MQIKELLTQYSITPNKALGQNFLADSQAVTAIIDSAKIDNKNVLEIGPGLGSLTLELNRRASKLLAVELDKAMVSALTTMQGSFPKPADLEILNADFLKVGDKLLTEKLGNSFCVVANLPYYVTTPICMKLLQSGIDIQSMTLMMQKEAATHFVAKKGTKQYGPCSVLSSYLYSIETVIELSPASYYPQPEVNSIVLKFTSKGSDLAKVQGLSRLLKASFANRRKTILNNIQALCDSKAKALELLEKANIAPTARAEQLELADYLKLLDVIA